jgi:hypothetical protein
MPSARCSNSTSSLALSSRDFETIERLYASQFTLNSPAGRVQTRQETMDLLFNSDSRQTQVERTIEAAYAVGDVVVIMGEESLVWEDTGRRDLDGRRTARRFTNVWRRIDGEWRHIARQATTVPLQDPDGAARDRRSRARSRARDGVPATVGRSCRSQHRHLEASTMAA